MDLGKENGSKLAPKSEPKSILALKRKNQLNASPLVPNWVRRVQVGCQNRSKIDQNLKSKMGSLLASIFNGFWWVLGGKLGGKIELRSIKNRFKKASKKLLQVDRSKNGLYRSWGGESKGAPRRGAAQTPPFSRFLQPRATTQTIQSNDTTSTALTLTARRRAEARWRI